MWVAVLTYGKVNRCLCLLEILKSRRNTVFSVLQKEEIKFAFFMFAENSEENNDLSLFICYLLSPCQQDNPAKVKMQNV